MHSKTSIGRIVMVLVILIWSLFPVYWTLNTSLMNLTAADAKPVHWVPTPLTWVNYRDVLGLGVQGNNNLWPQFSHAVANSAIESVASTLLTLIVASFAAYAFARLKFRGKSAIFYVVLGTLALPAYATLIPLYRILGNVGLDNTYLGIVLVYTSGFMPLAMWILYSYFSTIPLELEEAASIDGASRWRVLFGVVMPLAVPGLVATAIITFLFTWGQFLFPLVLSSGLTTEPLTIWIGTLSSLHVVSYTLLAAVGIMAIVVPALIVVFLNRFIIRGMTQGSFR